MDVIIETPGGDGAVAEDIVRLLRGKFDEVCFIVPGYAKSAGTIIVMSGDDILMGPTSALGPIDAQLLWQGKVFSAERAERPRLRAHAGQGMAGPVQVQGLAHAFEQREAGDRRREEGPGG